MLVLNYQNEKTAEGFSIDVVKDISRVPLNLARELLATVERVIRAAIAAVLHSLGYKPKQIEVTPSVPVVPTPVIMVEKTWAQSAWDHKGKIAIGGLVVLGLALAFWYNRQSDSTSYEEDYLDRLRYGRLHCTLESKKWVKADPIWPTCKNCYNATAEKLRRELLKRKWVKPPDYEIPGWC